MQCATITRHYGIDGVLSTAGSLGYTTVPLVLVQNRQRTWKKWQQTINAKENFLYRWLHGVGSNNMHLLTLASSICLPSSEALFSTSEIVIALLLLFPVTNTIFRLQSDFSVKYSKFQGGIQEIHGHNSPYKIFLLPRKACKPKPSFSNCEPYRLESPIEECWTKRLNFFMTLHGWSQFQGCLSPSGLIFVKLCVPTLGHVSKVAGP